MPIPPPLSPCWVFHHERRKNRPGPRKARPEQSLCHLQPTIHLAKEMGTLLGRSDHVQQKMQHRKKKGQPACCQRFWPAGRRRRRTCQTLKHLGRLGPPTHTQGTKTSRQNRKKKIKETTPAKETGVANRHTGCFGGEKTMRHMFKAVWCSNPMQDWCFQRLEDDMWGCLLEKVQRRRSWRHTPPPVLHVRWTLEKFEKVVAQVPGCTCGCWVFRIKKKCICMLPCTFVHFCN